MLSQSFPELGIPTPDIAFDYAIYALGSHPPPPLNLWDPSMPEKEAEAMSAYGGLKSEGCAWFKEKQKIIEAAPTILVVGGGALGIRRFLYSVESVLRSISLSPRIRHRYQGSVPGQEGHSSALPSSAPSQV